MIKNSLIRMISIVFITLFAQTTFAEALTPQEADLLIKEDVAATQVLAEVCPALTGNNPLLKTKIDALTQKLLKDLSKTSTLEQLQQDVEYKDAYKEAQASAKEVDKDEHEAVCADVLAF